MQRSKNTDNTRAIADAVNAWVKKDKARQLEAKRKYDRERNTKRINASLVERVHAVRTNIVNVMRLMPSMHLHLQPALDETLALTHRSTNAEFRAAMRRIDVHLSHAFGTRTPLSRTNQGDTP